jgi:hypothetical protein
MNCANHSDAPAVAYCRDCGKPLCEACRRQSDGTVYCEEHSPVTVHASAAAQTAAFASPAEASDSPYTAGSPPYTPPPPYTTPDSPYTSPQPPIYRQPAGNGPSPGLAFMLGFIPGVGAIYNAQYVKGLIHVIILGVLIAIVSNDEVNGNMQPLFGMMIAVWVFYMAFEAYHTAKKRQAGEPVDEFSSIVPRRGQQHTRFPLAPTVLIAVGLIFLLHNLDIIHISQMLRYWPIALIGLGAYMLYERVAGSSDHAGHGQGTSRDSASGGTR